MMSNNPEILISIIIPVYNVEQYLRECLDSVVNQTLREIEIICVNDGSTDGSLAILEEYAQKDARIQIVNQQNMGQSSARNVGMALAKGRYIQLLDSDDTIDTDLCRMTFISAEYHHADVLFFDYVTYDVKSDVHYAKNFPTLSYAGNTFQENDAEKMKRDCVDGKSTNAWAFLIHIGPPLKLFRTDFLRENQLFFSTHLRRQEDVLFHWKVWFSAKRVGVLPAHLYYYRSRPGSVIRKGKGVLKFYSHLLFEELKKELLDRNLYEIYKNFFISGKLWALFHHDFMDAHPKIRREVKQQILDSLTEDEWRYINDNTNTEIDSLRSLPYLRNFYKSLRGDVAASWKFNLWWWFYRVSRSFLGKLGAIVWRAKINHFFAKRFSKKYVEQNRQLCNLIVDLQEEILTLRQNTK